METKTEEVDTDSYKTTYTRRTPAISSSFNAAKESGIGDFSIILTKQPTASKDTLTAEYSLSLNQNYSDTRYDEGEFAIKVSLTNDDKDKLTFPEGAQILYDGKLLEASADNSYVIIPAKTAGSGEFTIKTTLEGWEKLNAENITLQAELYSASVASYYNSINTDKSAIASFTAASGSTAYNLDAAIGESDSSTNRLLKASDMLNAAIKASGGNETDTVSVGLYRYNGASFGDYTKLSSLSEVFSDAATSIEIPKEEAKNTWKPTIANTAQSGTYRLEFKYGDKTDYLDFIVR